ncbi:MAG: heterodisulfide reductase-related iron-sulfur binding cluster [Thermaerobacter sp.]|nr:heterodisulfide reductase-related iron-sulfur binding cluster [Thermaerobacter sp.]
MALAEEPHAHSHDIRQEMRELEDKGEIKIQRVVGPYEEVEVAHGIKKKIPTTHLYQHKSCGQCTNLPGVPASSMYVYEQLGIDYLNDMEHTSCTAWNYHASATNNLVSLAAAAVRNWHRVYETGYNLDVHCVTSFGNYQEMRHLLVTKKEIRDEVRKIMHAIGRELVIPEEVVHNSEVMYVLRDQIAAKAKYRFDGLRAVDHIGCHFYKIMNDDVIGGAKPIVVRELGKTMGFDVQDYSKWFHCCGFGFRHILVNREFTRSALRVKLQAIQREVDPDVILVNCTGCGTTIDKNQWIMKAVGENYSYPALFHSQIAALSLGADPYKVAGINFHATPVEPVLKKVGIL